MEGFYLYIDNECAGFIKSKTIPKIQEIIDYNDKTLLVYKVLYQVIDNKFNYCYVYTKS